MLVLHLAMTNVREPPAVANELVPSSSVDYLEKLKNRYLQFQWPNHRVVQYVRLALILEKEDVTPEDECLDKITKLTLQGEVDIIRKKKEPLHSLEDIFHYQNQPCPRLILIMGGPGTYTLRIVLHIIYFVSFHSLTVSV